MGSEMGPHITRLIGLSVTVFAVQTDQITLYFSCILIIETGGRIGLAIGAAPHYYHRLNGSSSPVLTATCLSYGMLCDFLGFFSRTDLEVTPLDRF